DAVKRAFRSFGNQFGNSLYNKSRNQNQPQQEQPHSQQQQYSQSNQQPKQQTQTHQQQQTHNPYDYSSLYNIGLSIFEQGQNLIISGEDLYNKRDILKACGFRFDASSKLWWKPIEQQSA
ncbi:MAG: Rad52/Rad22 family DNA repair protein, partial [Campylobacterales bacterium]|nr:Rad52/Rad22 family DNA repair protein [Campylobacterales bacterium]